MHSLIDLWPSCDSTAIIYVNSDGHVKTISYQQFWCDAHSFAATFQRWGAGKNSVIGIYIDVNELLPILMVAIMLNKSTFTILSSETNFDLMCPTLNYVICPHQKMHLFVKLIDGPPSFEHIFEGFILLKIKQQLFLDDFKVEKEFDEEFAYLISTSGTTGTPKIVCVPHACITPNVIDLKTEFKVTQSDTILVCSPFTFDPSIVDVFIGLSSGSQVLIVDHLMRINPQKLSDIIIKFRVSLMTVTPSFLSRFPLQFIQNDLLGGETALRVLVFGGEKSPTLSTIKSYCIKNAGRTTLYNIYGVTEMSSWASIYKVDFSHNFDEEEIHLPIHGTSLLNTEILVDEGECIICSDVRRCFIINYEGTRAQCGWSTKFRTGDLIKKSQSGHLFIVGRSDFVVKLNGVKVDLNAIEEKVKNEFQEDVSSCVCVASEWMNVINAIVNVFIICYNQMFDETKLLQFLYTHYGKTTAFRIFRVTEFPLTFHAKVDRQSLLENVLAENNSIHVQFSYNDIEETVLKILKRHFIINSDVMNLSDAKSLNLIALGVDSIKALQISIELENEFNSSFVSLIDKLLNHNLNVTQICDYINSVLVDTVTHSQTDLILYNKRPLNESHHINKRIKLQENVSVVSRRGLQQFAVYRDDRCEDRRKEEPTKLSSLKICWSYDLSQCIDASPLIIKRKEDPSLVFIGSHSGKFVCIELYSGHIKWQKQLNDRIESSACCDPSGQYVYVGDYSGRFYCLSANSGVILWKFMAKSCIKSSPICSQTLVFCGSHDHYLHAWHHVKCKTKSSMNCDDGLLAWKTIISDSSIFSSPILSSDEETVYAAALDGSVAAVAANDGNIRWKKNLTSAIFSSPAVINEILIVGLVSSQILGIHCIDGSSLWSFDCHKPVFSSPFVYKELIFIGTHDNNVLCLNSSTGQLRNEYKVDSPVYSTPFVDEKLLIFGETNGCLHVIDLQDDQEVKLKMNGELFSSCIMSDNKLLVGCRDNSFYCISVEHK